MRYDVLNSQFESAFDSIPLEQRRKPAALLSIIPEKHEWEEYIEFIRQEWRYGRIIEFPFCLITLYASVAFFAYESGDFWKPFEKTVNNKISNSERKQLHDSFFDSVKETGLEFLSSPERNDFVGSAIFQIGVPLTYWDDFLKICENLWWKDNWQNFTNQEWEEFVTRKVGPLQRLKRFLLENPNTARRFIKEVHDVRELINSGEIPIEEVLNLSFLRPEHFEEVPETADFLSPLNPEKLFKNQFQIVFDESNSKINLYLPPVKQEKLPAVWKINDLEIKADLYQQQIEINAHAFQTKILFQLESEHKNEKRKINGIESWALFDEESGYRINIERQSLPLKSYTVLSLKPLENVILKGFDDDAELINQTFELNDGSNVFITKLVPLEEKAKVCFAYESENTELKFQSKGKVNIFLLAGRNEKAMQFRLFENTLKTNHLPVPCLTLPIDLFEENEVDLAGKFKVLIDEQETSGKWQKTSSDNYNEIYIWEWNEETKVRKNKKLIIECEGLGIKKEFKIEVLQPKENLAECWNNFPDKYLPFILLAQPNFKSDKGTTFDEMREIKEIIAPNQRFVGLGFFHFYEKFGILKGLGNRWQFDKSKLYLGENEDGSFLRYCGNPCVFWQLIRFLSEKFPQFEFGQVEVFSKKGELTHLYLALTKEQKEVCEKYANDYELKYGIVLVNEFWEEIKWIR
jgi:hypothetical protein